MKRLVTAGLVIAGIMATGCKWRVFQMSVQPFLRTSAAPADVTGRWLSEGDAGDLVFVHEGENAWQIQVFDSKDGADERESSSGGIVRFGRVGGALYWDMTAQSPESAGDLAREHLLELHSVARVRLDGDTMEIALLNPEWMRAMLDTRRVELAYFRESGEDDDADASVVLTAPTPELEAFLLEHGEDPQAFAEPEAFHRAH